MHMEYFDFLASHACYRNVQGSWRALREPTQTQGEHASSTQEGPRPGIELATLLVWGAVLTTPPQKCLIIHKMSEM